MLKIFWVAQYPNYNFAFILLHKYSDNIPLKSYETFEEATALAYAAQISCSRINKLDLSFQSSKSSLQWISAKLHWLLWFRRLLKEACDVILPHFVGKGSCNYVNSPLPSSLIRDSKMFNLKFILHNLIMKAKNYVSQIFSQAGNA